jgi:pimeloyl-ACP methyl ester carboxylesterase
MEISQRNFVFIFLMFLAIFSSCQLPGRKITPPGQPARGPGGSDYRHNEVKKSVFGQGDTQYWIYEPAAPTPTTAPVIVFVHGWTATNPKVYGGWIKHLVRRGNIVIYPRFQASILTPPRIFVPHTAQAIRDALKQLERPGHVRPIRDKFAMVGHSVGGAIAANLAAKADFYGLPHFKAIFCVEPASQLDVTGRGTAFEDLSQISSTTLLLSLAGDSDLLVGGAGAKKVFALTTSIPPENKNLLILHSDAHGFPPLQANHLAPLAFDKEFDNQEIFDPTHFTLHQYDEKTADTLDYFGFWKLFDALTDAAFDYRNRKFALGNTPQQRTLGFWSDGQAVKEITVLKNP